MPPHAQEDTTADRPNHALQPASYTSHFVQAGDVRLHYLDYGTAGRPAMLCIHGGAAHSHWFDFIAPGFTPDYHVRSLDLRGHGDSDAVDPPSYYYQDYASDLNKAVEKLDLRDFVLIGHSMGGMVSLLYAATYPGRAKSLVVVDTSVNLSPERIAKLRDVGSKPGRNFESKDELVSRYKLRPGESFATPEVVRYIASHSARQADDGTWRYKFDRAVYATRESMDGMPLWDKVKIPALLVKADHSERITPEVYADAKARAPQVELAEVSKSDHHVTLDNPAEFVGVVNTFLRR
ncbi:MAG TPA: alpha/beta hydrolase [Burkholderiales bacterium]|nr:alpha/beta hydrolase [Burkholderiales bacterium]